MDPLTPSQRRALRAKAHHLDPVVAIGQHGLTPAVAHEIDVALTAHELVKIRVLNEDRHARTALLARICAEAGCAPVQHLGKLLIVWRPSPEPAAVPVAAHARAAAPRRAVKHAPAATPPRRRETADAAVAGPSSRRRRVSAAGHGTLPPGKRPAVPHGKSPSSTMGASGARRRRKAR